MANVAELTIKVLADASQANRELQAASGHTSKMQGALGKMAVPAAAAATAIAAFGVSAIKSASKAEQAAGAVDAVFKQSADSIHSFAKSAAENYGLSTSATEEMAAVFGSQLKNMGVAADQLAPKTKDLVGLGADLAAQYGGTTADAVESLSALLRGERDPIEKYGVSIKQADIDAQKMAMGLDKATGAAKKNADLQATLALLTKQTADAQGASAREHDTTAAAAQRAAAQYENLKASLGQALLPAVVAVLSPMADLAGFLGEHTGLCQALIGVIGGLSVVVLAANGALKAMALAEAALGIATEATTGMTIAQRVALIATTAAQKAAAVASKAWAAAQWLVNVAMTANPIGIVIAAIVALIAIVVAIATKTTWFQQLWKAAWSGITAAAKATWDWIKQNWPLILAILTGPVGIAVGMIVKHWDSIKAGASAVLGWFRSNWGAIKDALVAPFQAAWNLISSIINKIMSGISSLKSAISSIPTPKIPDLNPFSASTAAYAYTAPTYRGVARAPAATSGRSSGGVTVNVNGALDPVAVARQIRQVLARDDIRNGRSTPYQIGTRTAVAT